MTNRSHLQSSTGMSLGLSVLIREARKFASMIIKPICSIHSRTFNPIYNQVTWHIYFVERLVFRTKPVDTRLAIGSEASILCTADGPGTVAPSITWRRIGYATLPGHVRDVAGVLQFGGVRTSDSGSYVCTATSSDKQQTIDVTIRVDVSGMTFDLYYILSSHLDLNEVKKNYYHQLYLLHQCQHYIR